MRIRAKDVRAVMRPALASGALGPARDVVRRARALILRERVRRSALPVGLVLVYHLLDDRTGDPEQDVVVPHSSTLFAAHLAILHRHYRLVLASEFPGAVAERRPGDRPPLAITFDDDSPSHVERALPALAAVGAPATFFLTGEGLDAEGGYWWVDLEAVWRRSDPPARAGLAARVGAPAEGPAGPTLQGLAAAVERLRSRDRIAFARELRAQLPGPPEVLAGAGIRALAGAGHEIGFHTRRHDRLTDLDPPELEQAMVDGRELLASAAGAGPRTIAYPHGRADPGVAAAAREHGFAAGFTTVARRHRAGDDLHEIGRYWPSYGSARHFELDVAMLMAGQWGPPVAQ